MRRIDAVDGWMLMFVVEITFLLQNGRGCSVGEPTGLLVGQRCTRVRLIVVFGDGRDVQLGLIRCLAIRFVLQLGVLRLRLLELRLSNHRLLDTLEVRTGTGASSSTGITAVSSQGGTLVHVGRRWLVAGDSDRLWANTHILGIEAVEAIVANVSGVLVGGEGGGRGGQFLI